MRRKTVREKRFEKVGEKVMEGPTFSNFVSAAEIDHVRHTTYASVWYDDNFELY